MKCHPWPRFSPGPVSTALTVVLLLVLTRVCMYFEDAVTFTRAGAAKTIRSAPERTVSVTSALALPALSYARILSRVSVRTDSGLTYSAPLWGVGLVPSVEYRTVSTPAPPSLADIVSVTAFGYTVERRGAPLQ